MSFMGWLAGHKCHCGLGTGAPESQKDIRVNTPPPRYTCVDGEEAGRGWGRSSQESRPLRELAFWSGPAQRVTKYATYGACRRTAHPTLS